MWPLPLYHTRYSIDYRRMITRTKSPRNRPSKQTLCPFTKIVSQTTQAFSPTFTFSKAMNIWTRGRSNAFEDRNSMKWNLASPCSIRQAMQATACPDGSRSNAKNPGLSRNACSKIQPSYHGRVVPYHHLQVTHPTQFVLCHHCPRTSQAGDHHDLFLGACASASRTSFKTRLPSLLLVYLFIYVYSFSSCMIFLRGVSFRRMTDLYLLSCEFPSSFPCGVLLAGFFGWSFRCILYYTIVSL